MDGTILEPRVLSLLFVLAACACGCGGGDDGGGVDGGGGEVADASGGGAPDAVPVDCPGGDGAPELEVESLLWPGDQVLCGTAALPEEANTLRATQLVLYRVDRPGNEFLGGDESTNTLKRVHYRVSLEPGEYRVGLRVDDTGDDTIGSGDLQGFYDGTVDAPILDQADAAVVDLETAQAGVDFGLGRLP